MPPNPDNRGVAGPERWFDWLVRLAVEELAPRPLRVVTALRFAIIASVGTGLMAACHVDSPLGPYIIWLLLGAVPMMSLGNALVFLAAEGSMLALSVPIAGILAETPWLLLPAMGAFAALITRVTALWKLGALGLVLEVVSLDTVYAITFAPDDFGWSTAAVFGGSVIGLLVLTAFDSWLWPAPAEAILIESLAAADDRMRKRLMDATRYYLGDPAARRPPNPPASSAMPAQLALLDRAIAEGISPARRAILLAAITRAARIHIEIDRLIVAVREPAPRYVRGMLGAKTEAAAQAIAAALDEIAREERVEIRTGPDKTAFARGGERAPGARCVGRADRRGAARLHRPGQHRRAFEFERRRREPERDGSAARAAARRAAQTGRFRGPPPRSAIGAGEG